MAQFKVGVTVRLEIHAEITVKAKTGDAAEEEIEDLINDGVFDITWTAPKIPTLLNIHWEEQDQEATIEYCDDL